MKNYYRWVKILELTMKSIIIILIKQLQKNKKKVMCIHTNINMLNNIITLIKPKKKSQNIKSISIKKINKLQKFKKKQVKQKK